MKWLKLDCDFPDDPKIRCLAREWGGETAAAFWTLLLAFVGRYGGSECRVKIEETGAHSPIFLASRLSSKPQVALRRLSRAAQLGLIHAESWENDREIFMPNMLKRVDDYSRKVRTKTGQTTDKVHLEEEREEEVDKEVEERKKTLARVHAAFAELWAQYPAKDGRKEAEKHFRASVKTEQDLADIRRALTNYLSHLKTNHWKQPKNGSTWFNNWRDWVNWIEPEVKPNGTYQQNQGTGATGKPKPPSYTPRQ